MYDMKLIGSSTKSEPGTGPGVCCVGREQQDVKYHPCRADSNLLGTGTKLSILGLLHIQKNYFKSTIKLLEIEVPKF